MDNRRTRTRVRTGMEGFLQTGRNVVPVQLSDVSVSGALCHGAEHMHVGQYCELIIQFAPGLRLAIDSRVVRIDEMGTAIDFVAMDDESFTHLVRMVELNAANPDVIEDELRGRR